MALADRQAMVIKQPKRMSVAGGHGLYHRQGKNYINYYKVVFDSWKNVFENQWIKIIIKLYSNIFVFI